MAMNTKFQLLLLLYFFLNICLTNSTFVIDCNYKESRLDYEIGSAYQCGMKNDFPFIDETPVSSASDNHMSGKDNTHVTAFTVYKKILFKIPNLTGIFTNISYINIRNSPLRYLKKENLAVYATTLKRLIIMDTNIEIIDADLFNGFTKLETLDLQNNRIFFIRENNFISLVNLTALKLRGNGCKESTTPGTDIGNFDGLDANSPNFTFYIEKINNSTCRLITLDVLSLKYQESKFEEDFAKHVETKELYDWMEIKENQTIQCNIDLESVSLNLTITIESYSGIRNNITSLENQISQLNSTALSCKALSESKDVQIVALKTDIERLESEAEKCKEVNGTCRFTNDSINGYSCIARNISITSPGTEIEWTGDHNSTNTNRNVISLIIRDLNVQYVPTKITDQLVFLQKLIIHRCGLKKLFKTDFQNLYFVSTIQLTSNNISAIDSGAFDDGFSLEILDLSDNKIKTLPLKIFAKLDYLHTLKLDKNLLTSLKADLIATSNNIEYFSATDNQLAKVDSSFVWRLRSAKLIDFSGNGCDKKYNQTAGGSYIIFYSSILAGC